MKRGIIFVLSLFALTSVYPQKKTKKEITVTEGVAIPVFSFSSNDLGKANAGFALPGDFTKISYTNFVWGKVGIKGYFLRQWNTVKKQSLEEYARRSSSATPIFYPVPVTSDEAGGKNLFNSLIHANNESETSGNSVFFKHCSWNLFAITIGPAAKVNLSNDNKLFFETALHAGLGYLVSPKLYGTIENDTMFVKLTQSSKAGAGFVYGAEAGLQYRIYKTIHIKFDINFLGSGTFNFKNLTSNVTGIIVYDPFLLGGNQQSWQAKRVETGKQRISSVNIGAGIVFTL